MTLKYIRFVLLAGLLLVWAVKLAHAQPASIPAFDKYPARVEGSVSKPPNLSSHREARLFRTALRNAAKQGINFAGHFVLTEWGCGSSCQVGAIINAKTGEVFYPEQLQGFWSVGWAGRPQPFGYQRNSRMLVFLGYDPGDYNTNRERYGYHVYVWKGRSLKKIKFIKQSFGED